MADPRVPVPIDRLDELLARRGLPPLVSDATSEILRMTSLGGLEEIKGRALTMAAELEARGFHRSAMELREIIEAAQVRRRELQKGDARC